MREVAYSDEYGMFDLSCKGYDYYKYISGKEFNYKSTERHDKFLIQTIKYLGEDAGYGLRIKYIEGNKYVIKNYDGKETVIEPKDINWIEIND